MANRPAPALMLREGDREELLRWTRSTTTRGGLALRARIVLAAAPGEANERAAQRFGTSKTTVVKWRARYQAKGLDGLLDEPRAGRPGARGIVKTCGSVCVTRRVVGLLIPRVVPRAFPSRRWRRHGRGRPGVGR